MHDLEHDYKAILLADHKGPCISLYQPTHRTFPDRQQDPIRFGNLLKEIEASLERQHGTKKTQALLEPFRLLAADDAFWNHTLDGIAVFATETVFKVYNLLRSVTERVIVADSFHTKPLVRILQSADRYHVLGLNRRGATLFEGNRYALDAVDHDAAFPHSSSDTDTVPEGQPDRMKRAHGPAGAGRMSRHGMTVRQDAVERDTRQFFREVDAAVQEHYSKPTGLPLLLAALPEHHHLFREISENPELMRHRRDVDPASVSSESLRARAWDIVLPRYLARLDGLIEHFGSAKADHRGSADLAEIGKAVAAGRVATLLIDADRVVPGRFAPDTGAIEFARLEEPDVDDLLDDLSEQVVRTGGDVVIVPADKMPSDTGIAAIYRF